MFYSIDFFFLVIISSKEVGIDSLDPKASFKIRDYLCRELSPVIKENRPIVFICIGSDRSTGDALGPLIGEKIKFLSKNNIFVYGTLEETVHAGNLKETVKTIKSKHKRPFIIAIDACYTVMLLANAISNGIHNCILKSVGFKKNILDSTLENIL